MVLLKNTVSNETQWSSTYTVLKRYRELRGFLPDLYLSELRELLLWEKDDITLKQMFARLADLYSKHGMYREFDYFRYVSTVHMHLSENIENTM